MAGTSPALTRHPLVTYDKAFVGYTFSPAKANKKFACAAFSISCIGRLRRSNSNPVSDTKSSFSLEEEENLAELKVRLYPCLFDKSVKGYKQKDNRHYKCLEQINILEAT